MKVILRVITVVSLLASTAILSSAEDYQCRNASGCAATKTQGGVQKRVVFRKGDIVSTERGFAVAGDNGWIPVD